MELNNVYFGTYGVCTKYNFSKDRFDEIKPYVDLAHNKLKTRMKDLKAVADIIENWGYMLVITGNGNIMFYDGCY